MAEVRWPLPRRQPPAVPRSRIITPPAATAGAVSGTAALTTAVTLTAAGTQVQPATAALSTAVGLSAPAVRAIPATAALTTAVTLTAALRPYRQAVTADSPTAWWRLDEASGSLADSVGSNTLTVTGSPTYSATRLATLDDIGTAVTFSNASLTYAEAASSSVFVGTSSGLSVEALFQSTSVNGNNRLIEYGADSRWALYFEGGQLKFTVFGHGSAVYTWAGDTSRHHAAGTYDAATGITQLYLDGVLVGQQVAGVNSGTITSTTDALRLAGKPTGATASDGWNGTLDEVALYGAPLTPERIRAHALAANLAAQVVLWSGELWDLANRAPAAPYVNSFSGSQAWVDSSGYLHVRVDPTTGGNSVGVELASRVTGRGYGKYACAVATELDNMHPNVVFGGLFTYGASADYGHREIDVNEQSMWSGATGPATLSQTVWMPTSGTDPTAPRGGYNAAGNITTTSATSQLGIMTWLPSSVSWKLYTGLTETAGNLFKASSVASGQTVTFNPEAGGSAYTGPALLPVPSDERMMLNLWVCPNYSGTTDPATVTGTEVVVQSVSYTPLATLTTAATLNATGTTPGGTAALSTAVALSAPATRAVPATAALSTAVALSAPGTLTQAAAATLNTAATLTAAATQTWVSTATLSTAVTLTASQALTGIQIRAGTNGTASATTITPTAPAGLATGDLWLLVMRVGAINQTVSQTGGTGTWTIHSQGNNTSGGYTYCFAYRVYASGDTAPTFSWAGTNAVTYSGLALYDADGDPLTLEAWGTDVHTSTAGNTVTPPAATAGGSGRASVILTCAREATVATAPTTFTYTPPTGWATTSTGTSVQWTGTTNSRFSAAAVQLSESGTITPGSQSLTDNQSGGYFFSVAHAVVAAVPSTAALTTAVGLSAPATVVQPSTAALSTAVTLTAPGTITQPAAAALTTAVGLSAPATLVQPVTAALATAVALSATGTLPGATAALTTAVALGAAATRVQPATAALSTAATLAAPGVVTQFGAAALTTAVTLAATAVQTQFGAAALTTAVTLTATATQTWVSTAALSTAVALSAPGVVTQPATAALTTAVALSAPGVITRPATAALTTAVTLAATATQTWVGAASLSTAVALTATGTLPGAAATLTSAVGLTATATQTWASTAALTTAVGLSAPATVVQPAVAALSTAVALSAPGVVTQPATAALTTAVALTATATQTWVSTAALSTAVALSAAGGVGSFAALTTAVTLAASAVRAVPGTVPLTTTVTLSAAVIQTQFGTAGLVTVVTLSAGAGLPGQAALTTAVTLTAVAVRQPEGAAVLATVVTLTAGATLVRAAAATLTTTPVLTAAPTLVQIGAATLSTQVLLTALATLTQAGLATLVTHPVLTATGTAVDTRGREGDGQLLVLGGRSGLTSWRRGLIRTGGTRSTIDTSPLH